MHSYQFIPFHLFPSLNSYPSIPIHPFLSIHSYPSILIHSFLSIYSYPSIPIHLFLSIHPYLSESWPCQCKVMAKPWASHGKSWLSYGKVIAKIWTWRAQVRYIPKSKPTHDLDGNIIAMSEVATITNHKFKQVIFLMYRVYFNKIDCPFVALWLG